VVLQGLKALLPNETQTKPKEKSLSVGVIG